MWILVVVLFLNAPLGGMLYSRLSEDIHNMDMSTSSPIIVMAGVMGSLFGLLSYFALNVSVLVAGVTVLLITATSRFLASLKVTHSQMGLDKQLVLGIIKIETIVLLKMSIIAAVLYMIAESV